MLVLPTAPKLTAQCPIPHSPQDFGLCLSLSERFLLLQMHPERSFSVALKSHQYPAQQPSVAPYYLGSGEAPQNHTRLPQPSSLIHTHNPPFPLPSNCAFTKGTLPPLLVKHISLCTPLFDIPLSSCTLSCPTLCRGNPCA